MNRKQKTCDSCGEQIVFLKTADGRAMPVDAVSVDLGDQTFDKEKHKPHWATCNDPNRFRRKRA